MRRRGAAASVLISSLALVQLSCGGSAGQGKQAESLPPGVAVCLDGPNSGAECPNGNLNGEDCGLGFFCVAAGQCVMEDASGQVVTTLGPDGQPIPCPKGTECPSGSVCPDVRLKPDEVRAIMQAAARAVDPNAAQVAVAVTDRRGVILGVGTNFPIDYQAACAESACPGEGFAPGSDPFTVDTALQLARTSSFFSADQTPLTSRAVRFISGEHFPAGVARTASAALFGIENTNRGCSFDAVDDPLAAAIPRARNLCSVLAQRDALPPLRCESSADSADQCGCSRGILTLPGGIQIYRIQGSGGRMAGGVGVFIRGVQPVPDPVAAYPTDPASGILRYDDAQSIVAGVPFDGRFFTFGEAAAALYAGMPNGLPNFAPNVQHLPKLCENPGVDKPACCFETPACDFDVLSTRTPPFDPVIFIDGIEIPEVATNPFASDPQRACAGAGTPCLNNGDCPTGDSCAPAISLSQCVGTWGRCSVSGQSCQVGTGACSRPCPGEGETCESISTYIVNPLTDLDSNDPLRSAQPVPQGWLIQPASSAPQVEPPVGVNDVVNIIDNGITEAGNIRGGIRLPLPARSRMMLAVSDNDNKLLGLFRMQDATVFSIDVAVAKSRNVHYFSSEDINPQDTMDCPGPANTGVPNQQICRGQAFAPGTAITNRTLSFGAQPFFPSGIEGNLSGFPFPFEPGPFRVAFIYDSNNPCTNGLEPPNGRQNGIVFFPGSTPIYRNVDRNGPLIGGFGISGDGVEQDDIVTVSGARAQTCAQTPCDYQTAGNGEQGFLPNSIIRADQIFVRGVRLPFVKFNRRPEQ